MVVEIVRGSNGVLNNEVPSCGKPIEWLRFCACLTCVRACVRAGVKACSCLHRVLAFVFCMHASVRVCVHVCTCHASTCKRVRVREHVREHVRERARVPSGVSARARARSLRRDSRFQSSMTRSSSPRAMRSAAGPRGLVAAEAGLHGDTLRARYWPVSGRGWDRLPSFSSSRRNESGRETAGDGLPYVRS